MLNKRSKMEKGLLIFLVISALIALSQGFSDGVLSNYFKEAYQVNALQRGFIEFPRELPGIISMFVIAALSFIGNIRIAIIAQIFTVAGLLVLGLIRPGFSVMCVILFVYSLGMHMYIPLGDSIGMSLAGGDSVGHTLGRINSVKMGFMMVAGLITFVGFRSGLFDFETPVATFLIAAALLAAGAACLLLLYQTDRRADAVVTKTKLIFKKEYTRYYVISALYGCRKQIMFVYSPWVLIDLLGFRADTMSILAIFGSLIGVFFMPVVGRWIDRYGIRTSMTIEALAFVFVYILYGLLSRWVSTTVVALTGIGMLLVYLLNIVDKMSAQFAMVRSIYMRSIAIVPEDVTPSLSLGMAIDHSMTIVGSYVCGAVWYAWGPEYVFLIAAFLSLLNLLAAKGIKPVEPIEPVGREV